MCAHAQLTFCVEYPISNIRTCSPSCTYVRRAPVSWFADEVFVGKKRHGRFGCRHRVSPRNFRRLRPWRFRGIRGIYSVNARTKRYQTTHSSKIKKKNQIKRPHSTNDVEKSNNTNERRRVQTKTNHFQK